MAGLPLRDAENFTVGGIHEPAPMRFWLEHVLPGSGLGDAQQAQLADIIRHGFHIPSRFVRYEGDVPGIVDRASRCTSSPTPPRVRLPNHPIEGMHPTAGCHRAFTGAEIGRLLASGAIIRVEQQPHMILPLGVAGDDGKKLRLILDARSLNLYIDAGDVQFGNLVDLARCLAPGERMGACDMKAGYHHLALTQASRTFVGFEWDGAWYVFTVLPFGLSCACDVFQQLTSTLGAFIQRRFELSALVYLDDAAFSERHPRRPAHAATTSASRDQQAATTAWLVVSTWWLAGFTLSPDKCQLTMSHRIRFLGFIVDTQLRAFLVPDDKYASLNAIIDETRGQTSTTVRALQRLTGKAQALSLAVPVVTVYLRVLYAHLAEYCDRPRGPLDAARLRRWYALFATTRVPVEPLREALDALRSIRAFDRHFTWRLERHVTIQVFSDASSTGMGGVAYVDQQPHQPRGQGERWREPVPPDWRDNPIHVLEALALYRCLVHFTPTLKDRVIDVYTDNEAVRFALLNYGARNRALTLIVRWIFEWALQNNVDFCALRVSTTENAVADAESRAFKRGRDIGAGTIASGRAPPRKGDAQLHPRLFARVQAEARQAFTVDAMATPRNRQMHRFISLEAYPDTPGFVGTNCLSLDLARLNPWGTREYVYVCPPWTLVPVVLSHLAQCHGGGAVVAPLQPTAPWYGWLAQRAAIHLLAHDGDADVYLDARTDFTSPLPPARGAVIVAFFDFARV
jgi:hypothetical protein